MKNLFRTLGISFFLTACLLFTLSFFKIIKSSNTIGTNSNSSKQSAQVSKSLSQQRKQSQSSSKKRPSVATQTQTRTQQRSTEKISFTVSQDDTSYSVANKLFEQGIIKNVDEFNNYMMSNNLSQFIQTGTFKLHKNMTLKELGETLTTYPGN